MARRDFEIDCELGNLTDDTGFAEAVKDDKVASDRINPSNYADQLPDDATHVVWYSSVRNRDLHSIFGEGAKVEVGGVHSGRKELAGQV